MKSAPRRIVFSLGLATLLVALLLQLKEKPSKQHPEEERDPVIVSQPPSEELENRPARSPVLGDQLLAQYGKPSGSLETDLEMFSHYLANIFILVKQRDSRHYSTNEDLAEFLLGEKGQKEPYLSEESLILNENGQLVDRLGSPLIVHPISKDQIEIRSAGPDRIPYTEDDLIK